LASPIIYWIIDVNIQNLEYSVFTLMECNINNIVDVPTNPTQCHPCSDVITNCLNCTSQFQCVICKTGMTVIDGQCSSCSNILSGCVSCTSPTNCNLCKIGWRIVEGGCTNISYCISVVQDSVANVATCTACSSGLTVNNSLCACPTGYWTVGKYCTNTIGCTSTILINN